MDYYYIIENNQQAGPFTLEQLRVKGITKDTLVWKEGMSVWTPAGIVDDLQSLFVKQNNQGAQPQDNNANIVGALPIGSKLNGQYQYRIDRVLGQGGYGITYLATAKVPIYGGAAMELKFAIKEHFDQQLNHRVGTTAVISNPNTESDVRSSIQDFLKEARRMNGLNHPNIVRVYENFQANNTAYYVMEYVEGSTLKDVVKGAHGGRLEENDALRLFRDIAGAVGYLHEQRILHLDINPNNIMMAGNKPKLIDFGLAKSSDVKGNLTKTNKATGFTDGYAPPEQYAGITTFIPEADIYALGAVLYFMLKGKNPRKSTELRPEMITNNLSSIARKETISAIVHAMEIFIENRTHSVEQLMNELNSQNINPSKPQKNSLYESGKTLKKNQSKGGIERFWRKNKLVVGVLGIGGLLVVGFFFVFFFRSKSGSGEVLKYYTDLSTIQIGDYLYADGTYTHKLDSANLTNCSGCVYNLTTIEREKREGWTHGHIVALKDAVNRKGETKFAWGPENSEIPICQNYSEAIKAKDGYFYCLWDSACQSPAICSIEDFDGNIFDEPLPDKCHWYVPTLSDWKDILVNLGKATVTNEDESLMTYNGKTVSTTLHNKIGGFKKNIGQTNDDADYSYWTCIQQGKGWTPDGFLPRAWAIYSYGEFGCIGNAPTRNKMSVRPVAAF